jgi:hypothetical protein
MTADITFHYAAVVGFLTFSKASREVPDVHELPAVRWRQQNLDSLSPARRDALVTCLIKVLQSQAEPDNA